MAPEARTQLDDRPSSAHDARQFVRDLLGIWGLDDPGDVAVLLTSEVVTNAVLHAGTTLTLSVRFDEGMLRVEVADGSPAEPVLRHVDPDAAGGRGLLLVESLAERWGAAPDDGGKVVWFEVPAAPR